MLALFITKSCGADDHTIHSMLAHGLDDDSLPVGVALRCSHEETVIVALRYLLNALQDFTEIGIVNVADNPSQGLRTICLQASGGGTGQVA